MINIKLHHILLFICLVALTGFQAGSASSPEVEEVIRKLWELKRGGWDVMIEPLRQVGDDAIEPLLILMRAEGAGEWDQRRVAWALSAIGTDKATVELLLLLEDPNVDPSARHEAARALGQKQEKRAVKPLLKILENKQEPSNLRQTAAYTLGNLQAVEAVAALVKALEEENVRIKMGVVSGLGRVGTEEAVEGLILALEDSDPYIRELAYGQLRRCRPEERTRWSLRALRDPDWPTRLAAAKDLGPPDKVVTEELIRLLPHTENGRRAEIIRLLGTSSSGLAVSTLIGALSDSSWLVRAEAAVALSRFPEAAILGPLLKVLSGAHLSARIEAAWVLGEINSGHAIEPLISATNDASLSWMAARSLGKLKAEASIPALTRLLSRGDLQTRRAAAWALAEIVSPSTRPVLKAAINDPDDDVRYWASLALERLTAQPAARE